MEDWISTEFEERYFCYRRWYKQVQISAESDTNKTKYP